MMIGVKGGTQTWSSAPQRADFKSDNANTVSASDKEKFFQDQDLGEILNKVSDPNWVDPQKKMKTSGNNELGKDAFMNLLLTQMKNQDPTNPLKSHEMAAQLAQFTSLEKMTNVAEGIQGLRQDFKPNANFQALAFIGKSILADNSKVSRTELDARHDIRFSLPSDATKATMEVKNADGAVVRTIEFKGLKAGKNELNWNGITDDGQPAPLGEYTVAIEAVGSNGRKLFVETKSEGTITGVNFTPQGPQLMIGKQVVNMADIKSITDPILAAAGVTEEKTSAAKGGAPQGPKMMAIKPENKPNANHHVKMTSGNINDAAMDQGLINKINKEGAKAGMG